jgi:hypothetical protein
VRSFLMRFSTKKSVFLKDVFEVRCFDCFCFKPGMTVYLLPSTLILVTVLVASSSVLLYPLSMCIINKL